MKNRSDYQVVITIIPSERDPFKFWLGNRPDGHRWYGPGETFVKSFQVQLMKDWEEIEMATVNRKEWHTPQDTQNAIDALIDKMIDEVEKDGP